jgi:hypothetical protein
MPTGIFQPPARFSDCPVRRRGVPTRQGTDKQRTDKQRTKLHSGGVISVARSLRLLSPEGAAHHSPGQSEERMPPGVSRRAVDAGKRSAPHHHSPRPPPAWRTPETGTRPARALRTPSTSKLRTRDAPWKMALANNMLSMLRDRQTRNSSVCSAIGRIHRKTVPPSIFSNQEESCCLISNNNQLHPIITDALEKYQNPR